MSFSVRLDDDFDDVHAEAKLKEIKAVKGVLSVAFNKAVAAFQQIDVVYNPMDDIARIKQDVGAIEGVTVLPENPYPKDKNCWDPRKWGGNKP